MVAIRAQVRDFLLRGRERALATSRDQLLLVLTPNSHLQFLLINGHVERCRHRLLPVELFVTDRLYLVAIEHLLTRRCVDVYDRRSFCHIRSRPAAVVVPKHSLLLLRWRRWDVRKFRIGGPTIIHYLPVAGLGMLPRVANDLRRRSVSTAADRQVLDLTLRVQRLTRNKLRGDVALDLLLLATGLLLGDQPR